MKPGDKLKALNSGNALERIEYCRAMLLFHHFTTAAENVKIRKRIKAWCDKNKFAVEERPICYVGPTKH